MSLVKIMKFNNIEIRHAKTFKDRFIGLMFKKNFNYGLLFKNCRAIHTFFMKESIKVIATDKNDKIVKIYNNVKPWRIIIAPIKTKNLYELPNTYQI